MKTKLFHLLQVFSLILTIAAAAISADAQVKPGRPAPYPDSNRVLPGRPAPYPDPHVPPRRPPVQDELLNREFTETVELGQYGLRNGQRISTDVTSDVVSRARLSELSSLVILASSERGFGELNVLINGIPQFKRTEYLSMKRRAIQVDVSRATRDVRSVVLETTGSVYIHSITVSTSYSLLPPLPDFTGNQGGGHGGGHGGGSSNEICDVTTAGAVGGIYKQYQIILKNQAIDGGDSLDEIINKLNLLEQNGICRRPSETTCTLGSAGAVNGVYKRLIIKRKNSAFAGGESLEEVINLARKLEDGNLCRMATHKCELTAAGATSAGQYYQHRLLINGEALLGANDMGTLLNQLSQLRYQRICQ